MVVYLIPLFISRASNSTWILVVSLKEYVELAERVESGFLPFCRQFTVQL